MLGMLFYVCETWKIYRHQEQRLDAFHFRCLRSILSHSWRDLYQILPFWRELVLPIYSLFSLKIYRLLWSYHVCRMEDGQLWKGISCGQLPSAPRPVVLPKLRYKDILKRDLKALNINTENWVQLTLERASWRQGRRNSGVAVGGVKKLWAIEGYRYQYACFCWATILTSKIKAEII